MLQTLRQRIVFRRVVALLVLAMFTLLSLPGDHQAFASGGDCFDRTAVTENVACHDGNGGKHDSSVPDGNDTADICLICCCHHHRGLSVLNGDDIVDAVAAVQQSRIVSNKTIPASITSQTLIRPPRA